MSILKRFTVTADHIKLIRSLYTSSFLEGAVEPGFDTKRPFGNSYIAGDIARILRWKVKEELTGKQEDRAITLYYELNTALQIILVTGKFEPGTYKCSEFDINWAKV